MNRRTDLLDRLSACDRAEEKNVSAEKKEDSDRLLRCMFRYYRMNDLETKEQHGLIFKALYMEGKRRTYAEIAAAFHIHSYTLDRYRQRYNKLAETLLEKLKNQKSDKEV